MSLKPIASYATAQPQNATLVTALVALLGILITQIVNTILARTGQKYQQELETSRAQAARFQAYLERMEKLLIDHQLRNANKTANDDYDDARVVAHAQTLAVLEGESDPTRKRILLIFLYDSGLIDRDNLVISLSTANLSGADLSGANLSGAHLGGAKGVTTEELERQAKSLNGATMPDGSMHD